MNERETALPLTTEARRLHAEWGHLNADIAHRCEAARGFLYADETEPCRYYVGLAALDAARAGDEGLRGALTKLDFDYVEVHVGPESRRFNPDEFADWLFRRAYAALFQPFGEVDSALRATDTEERRG